MRLPPDHVLRCHEYYIEITVYLNFHSQSSPRLVHNQLGNYPSQSQLRAKKLNVTRVCAVWCLSWCEIDVCKVWLPSLLPRTNHCSIFPLILAWELIFKWFSLLVFYLSFYVRIYKYIFYSRNKCHIFYFSYLWLLCSLSYIFCVVSLRYPYSYLPTKKCLALTNSSLFISVYLSDDAVNYSLLFAIVLLLKYEQIFMYISLNKGIRYCKMVMGVFRLHFLVAK